MRNIGGSVGIALVTTLLIQRSQYHQATLVSHITVWDPQTRVRLAKWASHFATQGSDSFTAQRRAMAMLYRETVTQAQLMAYPDDFWLLALLFAAVPLLLPFMRRIRLSAAPGGGRRLPRRVRTSPTKSREGASKDGEIAARAPRRVQSPLRKRWRDVSRERRQKGAGKKKTGARSVERPPMRASCV